MNERKSGPGSWKSKLRVLCVIFGPAMVLGLAVGWMTGPASGIIASATVVSATAAVVSLYRRPRPLEHEGK